ncbi:NAD(P)H-binding protein [Streptomyces sp. SID12488]|uniref:NAD(P)H-binding protein n=1 Tax=Streptomyces sp. SID12488 TaxID=2706040 RepID=UPI0013D98428|nr:NAD(P)H-binding protein [Streptomyces sp. SID12488]
MTRQVSDLEDLAARGASVRFGDFDEPASLVKAFAGASRVLLISTRPPGARVQHQNAIDAAKPAGASLIAYTSIPNPVVGVNAAAIVPDHAATEEALRAAGVAWTFMRNGLYAEMQVAPAQVAVASGTFAYNSGAGATAYVSREDCAAAVAAVLACGDEHAGKAYDITRPEWFTGAQLAELYASVGGAAVAGISLDEDGFVAGAVSHGMPEEVARFLASFGRAIREGQLNQLSGDVEALTGRAPVGLRTVLAPAPAAAASY